MRFVPLVVVLLASLTAGCGTQEDVIGEGVAPPPRIDLAGTATPSASGQPRTAEAVRKAATETFDSYSAGDYGESWDTWTAAGKKVVTRDYYVKVHRLCPSIAQGIGFRIKKIVLAADKNSAKVRASRTLPVLDVTSVATYRFVYEDGEWRWSPNKDTLADYRPKVPAAELAASWREQDMCGES